MALIRFGDPRAALEPQHIVHCALLQEGDELGAAKAAVPKHDGPDARRQGAQHVGQRLFFLFWLPFAGSLSRS